MPRRPRIELAGGIHHVTQRGNRKEPIFLDNRDSERFLRQLAFVEQQYRWIVLAYCLMPNHFHLVIETPETTLGAGMKRLGAHHAQAFNKRHQPGGGHVYQGRYGSKLVRSDEQFAQLLRYVALNPVKAGLSRDPVQWRWSSHPGLVATSHANRHPRDRIESLLAVWGGHCGTRYARLFDADHPVAERFGANSPWDRSRPPLEELLTGDDLNAAMWAAHSHEYPLSAIAAAVGLDKSTVSRRIKRASGAG